MSGGGAGVADLPKYGKEIHAWWLTRGTPDDPNPHLSTSVEDVMNDKLLITNNPWWNIWTGTIQYDPSSELSEIQSVSDDLDSLVDSIVPDSTTINNMVSNATSQVDSFLVTDTDIVNAVNDFQNERLNNHLDATARFAASMADVGAIMSSQFVVGLALLESDFERQISRFSSSLRLQLKRDRQALIERLVAFEIELLRLKLTGEVQETNIRLGSLSSSAEIKKSKFDADKETFVNIDLWDLQIFQFGANVLASYAGAAHPVPAKPSPAASIFSGILRGAAAGALFGLGPIGIAGAAGLGGLLEGLS